MVKFFSYTKINYNVETKIIVSFEGDAWDHEMLYLLSKKIGFKSIMVQTSTDLEVIQKLVFII